MNDSRDAVRLADAFLIILGHIFAGPWHDSEGGASSSYHLTRRILDHHVKRHAYRELSYPW